MLKIDEILKRLEEVDKVVKSADEVKAQVLAGWSRYQESTRNKW